MDRLHITRLGAGFLCPGVEQDEIRLHLLNILLRGNPTMAGDNLLQVRGQNQVEAVFCRFPPSFLRLISTVGGFRMGRDNKQDEDAGKEAEGAQVAEDNDEIAIRNIENISAQRGA